MDTVGPEPPTLSPCTASYGCFKLANASQQPGAIFATIEPCTDPWDAANKVIFSIKFIIPAILLILFNVLVIGGNLLVIISVFTCRKLRTITNTYIVSLAFADLLLGIFVLPFSGANEVLPLWPFGNVWCYIWLAVDVWLCTASILNLCVISFDRYLAISRPFKYQTIMVPWKAKFLVGCVWIVSFIISAPSLIGWNERGKAFIDDLTHDPTTEFTPALVTEELYNLSQIPTSYDESTVTDTVDTESSETLNDTCEEACSLNSDPGYVIYSALGSFWIPVWIMAFFYWRIYSIAARTTRGVRRGVLRTKSGGNSSNGNTVTLRIHRGGSCQRHPSVRSTSSNRSESQSESILPQSPPIGSRKGSTVSMRSLGRQNSIRDNMYKQTRSSSTSDCNTIYLSNGNGANIKVPKVKVTFSNNNNGSFKLRSKTSPNRTASTTNGLLSHSIIEEEETTFTENGQSDTSHHNGRTRSSVSQHNSVVNRIGNRFKQYNREKKAAKTVGIIVGCFVFCWAPFFTIYLLSAFCETCTPDIVFTIFFWLGYCNSAINPCVYALFSKDFRFAFKKLLCCRCERRPTLHDRRKSRFRSFMNSFKIQISSKSSDEQEIASTYTCEI